MVYWDSILITHLKLQNFKSVQGDELELKPLTIFAGPNSSGKSNLIEPIAILSQIAKLASKMSVTFPGVLENPDAEYFKYPAPATEYIVYKGELERDVTIELQLISNISKRRIGYSVTYNSEQQKTEQRIFINRNPLFYIKNIPLKEFDQSTIESPKIWRGKQTSMSSKLLLTSPCFLPLDGMVEKAKANLDSRLRNIASGLVDELRKEISSIRLLSAPRGTIPIETAPGIDPDWVGKNGQDLIMILSKVFGRRKYESIAEEISNWSARFGIGNIAAGLRKGSVLGADFEDPSLKTVFDLSTASYGSRQLLAIITQIFWSGTGSTLLIEEPELSLHPDSQMLILRAIFKSLGRS